MIMLMVEVTVHLHETSPADVDRIVREAVDHAVRSKIDGVDGLSVTWSDTRITGWCEHD